MKKQQTLPLDQPVVLYTEQGPLCGLILEQGPEALEVAVLFQQGGLPPGKQLPVFGAYVQMRRQAVLGWAPLQPLGKAADDVWALALERGCGLVQDKTFSG